MKMARRKQSPELCSVDDVFCDAQTTKAIHVFVDGEGLWIPQSVVHDDSEVWKKGDEGTLVLHLWWAEKNGLS